MQYPKLCWQIAFCLILSNNFFILGQKDSDLTSILKQQIELRHDNDFLLTTDRYYTSGLFFTYRVQLKKGIFKKLKEQIEFGLSQEIFTPEDIRSLDIQDYDRPYAGISSLRLLWSGARKSWLVSSELLFGQAGSNSGAGGFQRWYHRAIVIADAPVWVDEIANSFHTNLYITNFKEWRLTEGAFSVLTALGSKIAVGTRDIYIEPEVVFYFGRRNHLSESIAYKRVGSTKREIYFTLRASHRWVNHNAMLEGNLINDSSPFTVASNKSIMLYGFDFFHRYHKHDYKLSYRRIGAENQQSSFHQYIQLSYAYSF